MATYRYQVVSVGFWRGKVKRWNTTFHASSSALTANIKNAMMGAGFKADEDVLGDCSGGVASISVYGPAGGAPISKTVYFDWQATGTWIPYTGTDWASVPNTTPVDASGESAMILVGNLPGLSRTGKPLTVRKYLHAVPSRTALLYSQPDIDAATQAAVAAQFPPAFMASPSGVFPTTVSVLPYYGNHQRVRGRRRARTTVQAQAFSAGVVQGTSCGGGGAVPFQSK